ncbi:MAG: ABC transporter substrate-binding protein [Euryarchaeota archaeon]|nr:ABC transporter substrate-binding protein [Euryarchaeota archaeon]
MNGNRTRVGLLVLMCLAACFLVTVMSAVAQNQTTVSSDTDAVAKEVLASELMQYLRAEYLDEDVTHLSVEELKESVSYYPQYPRQIMDSTNRTVTIYKPITGIVVLNSDAGEAVKILGAGDKVVGIIDTVQEKTFYFPEMSKQALVGTWEEVEWEEIVDLHSKCGYILVITYTKYGAKVEIAAEKLEPFGIPVAGLNLYNPEDLPAELSKLSILLDSEENASKYLKWCEDYKVFIEEAVSGKERPAVFITKTKAIGLKSEIPTFGLGTTDNALCEMTGGKNVANLTTKYPKVSAEWVLREEPDIIIMKVSNIDGWDSETEPETLIAELLDGKGWNSLNAVNDNNVYVVPHSTLYGMEQPFAMAVFAKMFHPELDIEPTEVYKEFLEEFMRVDYPEDKIFVYPALAA